MNRTERLKRLDTMLAEGRIIRNAWTRTDNQGREFACLLAAISPEAGKRGTAYACPAEIMPAWLAHLTPSLDDMVSIDYWPKMLKRYAALAHRWHVLDDAAWHRAEYRVRAECVREAMRHIDNERTLKCCRDTIALCEREIAGDSPTIEEWKAANAAADAAAWAAALVDAGVDAWAAARAAANAAANAALVDAWAAARAAARAAAWWAANTAAEAAMYAAAGNSAYSDAMLEVWDLIAAAVFEAIEKELELSG